MVTALMIPYGRQNISEDDIDAVTSVLRSEFLTQGPVVPRFERLIADYCGAQRGVATNSATSALHLACMALGVSSQDKVWTTPISFVASANCAAYCGAEIDFVDIDPQTYNMSSDALESKLLVAEALGILPKAIIVVHLCGQSCEMERIHALSRRFGFFVVEDASHAIGGRYKNLPIGSCRYSDITIFSFHPVKIITTGEGGMALTNDLALAMKMERLRSHGITRDSAEMVGTPDGPWFYQQLDLGYNYRMTEMQAALGISQLARLDEFVAERQKLASAYDELLSSEKASVPWRHPDAYSSFHLYIIQLNLEYLNTTQGQIFERFRSHGIMVNLHYIPIYRHPYYRSRGHAATYLPNAERYYTHAITLPLYPGLKESEQIDIVEKLTKPLGYQTIF